MKKTFLIIAWLLSGAALHAQVEYVNPFIGTTIKLFHLVGDVDDPAAFCLKLANESVKSFNLRRC